MKCCFFHTHGFFSFCCRSQFFFLEFCANCRNTKQWRLQASPNPPWQHFTPQTVRRHTWEFFFYFHGYSFATYVSHHFDGFSRLAELSQTHGESTLYVHQHIRVSSWQNEENTREWQLVLNHASGRRIVCRANLLRNADTTVKSVQLVSAAFDSIMRRNIVLNPKFQSQLTVMCLMHWVLVLCLLCFLVLHLCVFVRLLQHLFRLQRESKSCGCSSFLDKNNPESYEVFFFSNL